MGGLCRQSLADPTRVKYRRATTACQHWSYYSCCTIQSKSNTAARAVRVYINRWAIPYSQQYFHETTRASSRTPTCVWSFLRFECLRSSAGLAAKNNWPTCQLAKAVCLSDRALISCSKHEGTDDFARRHYKNHPRRAQQLYIYRYIFQGHSTCHTTYSYIRYMYKYLCVSTWHIRRRKCSCSCSPFDGVYQSGRTAP